jgi:hypothetical protein
MKLPSAKELASGRHDLICEQIINVVYTVRGSHLYANRTMVDTVERILFTGQGAFINYERYSDKRKRRMMMNKMNTAIGYMAERHGLSPFPTETENIARQMQDEMDGEAEAARLGSEERERQAQHRAEQNALYEGGLGMLSAGHGNDGHVPAESGLADAFAVLAE